MATVPLRPLSAALPFAAVLLLAGCAAGGSADPAARAPAPAALAERAQPAVGLAAGAYTGAQATAGAGYFRESCAECHEPSEFTGADFADSWDGATVGRFVEFITESMPRRNPGSLTTEQYLAVTAYILQLNGYPTGPEPLPDDPEFLATLRLGER